MRAVALTIINIDNIQHIPGPLHVENPIKWAAYQAFLTSDGNPVEVIVSNDPPPGTRVMQPSATSAAMFMRRHWASMLSEATITRLFEHAWHSRVTAEERGAFTRMLQDEGEQRVIRPMMLVHDVSLAECRAEISGPGLQGCEPLYRRIEVWFSRLIVHALSHRRQDEEERVMLVPQISMEGSNMRVRLHYGFAPRIEAETPAFDPESVLAGFELETTEFEAAGTYDPAGEVLGTVTLTNGSQLAFTPAAIPTEPPPTPGQILAFLEGTAAPEIANRVRSRLVSTLQAAWPEHVGHPAPVPGSLLTSVDYAVSIAQDIGDHEDFRSGSLNMGMLVQRFIPGMRTLGRMVTHGPHPHNRAYMLECDIRRAAFQLYGVISITVGESAEDDL